MKILTLEESIARYERMRSLKEAGATYKEIGEMYGITRQAVQDRLKKGVPKQNSHPGGILSKNGMGNLSGRDRARMLVRLRDDFTCQDCGWRRTPEEVKEHNSSQNGLKNRIKLHDVHHLHGLCGKKSTGYDATNDLSGLVTLCHKCHYNRPEHRVNSMEFSENKKKVSLVTKL